MALALKEPLSLCARIVHFVDVHLLVPAADCEEVVCWRELQVRYTVSWELSLWYFDIFAGVAGG